MVDSVVKSKGTLAGLRMLINIFGVPDTVLKIREFGGKDKINTNNWDAFYRRYNYAYKTFTSSSALFPWMPLYKNYIESSQYIVPDTIQKDATALKQIPDIVRVTVSEQIVSDINNIPNT